MRTLDIKKAIKKYFNTTTLHGFKYLYAPYYADRMGWTLCCVASAGCAAILCAVFWARFLEVPALLTVMDNIHSDVYMKEKLPAIILCPSTDSVADIVMDQLSVNQAEKQRTSNIFSRFLSGKSVSKDQLSLLNDLLIDNNITLGEVMVNHAPQCGKRLKRCRYQGTDIPCDLIFRSEMTTQGVCCRLGRKKLENLSQHIFRTHSTEILDLVMQYTYGPRIYGCQLLALYDGEDDLQPDILQPGNYYVAHHNSMAVQDNPKTENFVKTNCIYRKGYSGTYCMFTCAEKSCGCRDPLHPPYYLEEVMGLPVCSVTRMACVRARGNQNNLTCNCLPSCRHVTTSMALYNSKLNVQHAIDPFFKDLNHTSSIVIQIRINVAQSRVFLLTPTDTWVTLLSSLGGVFNMFLGVGLFSVLEFIFFVLIKLPAAMKKASKGHPAATHQAMPRQQQYRHQKVATFPRGVGIVYPPPRY